MRRRVLAAVCALLALRVGTLPAGAQTMLAPPNGAVSSEVTIGGWPVTCSSRGTAVSWVADYALNDVGVARYSRMPSNFNAQIRYNPRVLDAMPDTLKLFWLGHECAHAYLLTDDESEADCWSATQGTQRGWFRQAEADMLAQQLASNPGDADHPPGPVRVAHVQACLAAAALAMRNTRASDPANDDFERALRRLVEAAKNDFVTLRPGLQRMRSAAASAYRFDAHAERLSNCTLRFAGNAPASAVCDVGTADDDDAAGDDEAYRAAAAAVRTLAATYGRRAKSDARQTSFATRDGVTVRLTLATREDRSTGAIDTSVRLRVDAPPRGR